MGLMWGVIAATRGHVKRAKALAEDDHLLFEENGPALAPPGGLVVHVCASERSAARLAHQSGGLGVASSNLAAPTST
jgi:hypothetical protein